VDVLGLELNKIGLLIKSRKGGALLWFNNKPEEPMFIKLEAWHKKKKELRILLAILKRSLRKLLERKTLAVAIIIRRKTKTLTTLL
jgi:hypothetical protein